MANVFVTTNAHSETWLPFDTRVCEGQAFTQITASGKTRQRVGIKPQYCRCTAGFSPKRNQVCAGTTFTASCGNSAWSHYEQIDFGTSKGASWSPNTSTVFVGTQFTQTSNCGSTRIANGTKPKPVPVPVPVPDSDADGVPNAADNCPATVSGQSVNALGCSNTQRNNVTGEESQAAITVLFVNNYLTSKRVQPNGVCVYTKTKFRGHRQCFTNSVVKLNDRLNNNVSSIRMSPEYKITIYQDENFAGSFESYNVNSDVIAVGFDNAITSVAVAAIGAPTGVDGQINPNDSDFDGINNALDQCPGSTPPSNSQGCDTTQIDSDNDGVNDALDQCPNTSGTANVTGCALIQLDSDNDGVNDAVDQCPGSSQSPNPQGCDTTQVDTDNDGVNDAFDQCSNTSGTPNGSGCALKQLDTDNDGVNDAVDQCPDTVSGLVGQTGCAVSETDTDSDGIPDVFDNTSTQCVDVDAFNAAAQ